MGVFIVVSGLPGSGKTTLARAVASDLALPLLSKDTIKEALFDSLGVGDVDWSKRLGRASFAVMLALARDIGSCVLESFWDPELARNELGGFGGRVIELHGPQSRHRLDPPLPFALRHGHVQRPAFPMRRDRVKGLPLEIAILVLAAGCGTGASDSAATPTTSPVAEASCPEVASSSPTSTSRPPLAPAPEKTEPRFRPATYREGDRTVMPVTFLDGTAAELVYDPKLALEEALVVPGWAAGTTPGGVDRDFVIRYGKLNDLASLITRLVSTELVRRDAIVCVYEFRHLYEYLVFQFEDWLVGIHSADDMSPDVRRTWARDLTLRVAPDGFPVLESAGDIYFWQGARLAFARGGPGIELRLDACELDETHHELGGLPGYGRRCVPGTGVEISTNNYAGATVDEVLQGLDIRKVRQAGST